VLILLLIIIRISKALGKRKLLNDRKMGRTLKENLGNFKFVKLKGNEEGILQTYGTAVGESTRAATTSNVLGVVPKSILESIGFSFLVGTIVFIIWFYEDAARVIPIIAVTSLSYKEDKDAAINAGMNYHLDKPIDPEKLLLAMLQLLADTKQHSPWDLQ
jgi:hypothetical protein